MSAPHVLVANIHFAPYTYGGATIVAEEVARALQDRHGWRVTTFSAVSRPDLPPYALRKMQVADVASYVVNLPPDRSYAERYSNPHVTEVADRLLQQLEPDLLHLHCLQELGTGLIAAARERGVPTVLSVHDYWWLCERQFMVRPDGRYCGQAPVRVEACGSCVLDHGRARTRFAHLADALSRASLVTYPSDFARSLSRSSGLLSPADAVWRNGVTLPEAGFAEAQARRRRSDPTLVFAYCGGPSDIKGWPQLRRALEGMESGRCRVKLVDGGMEAGWWQDTDLSTLPEGVEVVPRYTQQEMDAFWAGVDVLLFPSQWKETFGLTIREALCRGIRVIQTDSGGTVEHDGPDRDRLLPIGAGARALRAEIDHALSRPDRHAAPVAVPGFAEQADAFVQLTSPLLETRSVWQRPRLRDPGTSRRA